MNFFKPDRTCVAAAVILAVMFVSVPFSLWCAPLYESPFPEEPERYDSEYYLDMLTMRFDRNWRDSWDGSDNAFRLSMGSLNVEQWSFRESLKFSSKISRRFRFRYWMDQDRTLDEESGIRNEIEVEFKFSGDIYLSLLIGPSFWKRENDVGIGLQRRTAIDRYYKLIFKVHDFANDFAYEHGEGIEGEKNLYIRQPLELILEARDKIGASFRFGIYGFFTNCWKRGYRFLDHPEDNYDKGGRGRYLDIWLEKQVSSNFLFNLDMKGMEFFTDRDKLEEREEKHRVVEFLPRIWWYPDGCRVSGSSPEIADDSKPMIEGGSNSNRRPDKNDHSRRASRFSICAGVQVRHERWSGEGVEAGDFRKDELLPFILVQSRVSSRHMLETGYLADRYESERTGSLAGSAARWENRLKFAWELRFRGESRLRVIETIDLDREDWGEFSLHDHFFVMLRLAF